MADNSDVMRALFSAMRRDDKFRKLVHVADTNTIYDILKSYGYQGQLDPADLTTVAGFDNTFETLAQQEAREQAAAKAQAEADSAKVKSDYGKVVETVMSTDPRLKALYVALDAAGDGAHAMANKSRNDGNYLAQAILANSRSQSDKQESIYGKNIQDKAAGMTASDTMRRGENAGSMWDTLGNIIHKTIGKERQEGMTERQMKMIPYDRELNMPGDYYQKMSQDAKRAANLGKGD